MGMAFRGAPWKHLDFFLPESADAALLDVFCMNEPPPSSVAASSSSSTLSSGSSAIQPVPPLVAGKLNLNTRQVPALKAMLAGTLKDELTLDKVAAEANNAAVALVDRTSGTKPWQGPLTNVSELVGKLFAKDLAILTSPTDPVYISTAYRTATQPDRNPDMSPSRPDVKWCYSGYSADLDNVFPATKDKKTKRLRECVMRALADGGQTRVWNLMLDLVVQTGRFASSASKLEDFVRVGENRVWVYLAIDRLTGEILDQQLEWVTD
jgi:hypothetical protein